jgi:uncharacterized repeat protein (TIGR01451 family)
LANRLARHGADSVVQTKRYLSLCRGRAFARAALPAAVARWPLAAVCGALALLLGAGVCAQLVDSGSASGLKLKAKLEKVVESKGSDGTEHFELVPGAAPVAGEQFILTVEFANVAGFVADGVRITSTIPDGVSYIPGTATGPGGLVLFSADGGRTFATEEELAARAGATPPRPVKAEDYTHVRWVLEAPLEPGTTGFVRLRVTAR